LRNRPVCGPAAKIFTEHGLRQSVRPLAARTKDTRTGGAAPGSAIGMVPDVGQDPCGPDRSDTVDVHQVRPQYVHAGTRLGLERRPWLIRGVNTIIP
jgi:hypothetical protein